jgi:O-antigen/teichoic acid export membrane protein
MARALGPTEFGLVVLLHTYVLAVRALFNLKPAETFVSFGVPLLDRAASAETPEVARAKSRVELLLGLVRSMEWVSMLIATAVAVMSAPLIGGLFGWTDEAISVAMGYGLVLLASPVGTARGFCRATERFDVLRTAIVCGPAVRLVGVLLAWWYNATWPYFALAWALSLLASYIYLWRRGAQLIAAAGLRPTHLPWSRAGKDFPGLPSFLGVVYVQGLLDQLPRHLITLLIGSLLGSASAGLFRVAREIADVLAKPVQLIRQAAFTELTRLGQSGAEGLQGVFARYGLRLILPACALVLVAAIWREALLGLVGGEAYLGAGLLLVLLLIAAAVDLVGAILRPLAYARGRASAALRVQMLAMTVYLLTFVGTSGVFGLAAAGVAACAAALVTIVTLALVLFSREAHV